MDILVLIVAIIALAFPVVTALFVVILIAVALLFDGISRIVRVISDKTIIKGSRAFGIIAGISGVGVSVFIFASPYLGVVVAGILISIALLIIGVQIIVAGTTGRRFSDTE